MLAELTEMLGPIAKPLKLAFIGFCIAGVGVGVAFFFDFAPGAAGLDVCFLVTAVGVRTGFVGIAKGMSRLPAAAAEQIAERRVARAQYDSRPEIRALGPSSERTDKP